jgi:putative DNA primase/helicase
MSALPNWSIPTTPETIGWEINKLACRLKRENKSTEEIVAVCTKLRDDYKEHDNVFLSDEGMFEALAAALGVDPKELKKLDLADGVLATTYVAADPPLRFVAETEEWYGYEKGIWNPRTDPREQVAKFLHGLEPKTFASEDAKKSIHQRLYSTKLLQAVLYQLKYHSSLTVHETEFDPDPMLLGLPDGEVLDLRTGERRAASPDDLITRALPVAPKGTCPRWLKYLQEAHPNDEQLIAYLQRWAGYCLTASTKEDMILFLIGVGGSGKGTFAEPLQKLLADYCVSIPIGMLLESTNEDRRLNYIASLRGARLALCNEGSKMQRLDSRGIKLLTGGGWLTGRRLGHQPVNFKATHKIVVLANDNPVLELDDAMKQRVHVVPFTQKFRGEQNEEKGLREFFAEPEQLQGIFAWMLEGCLAYQREGLKPPASVTATTEQYFKDADLFEQFLQEETEEAKGTDVFLPTEAGFRRYAAWCERQGYTDKLVVGTTTTFAASLKQKRPHLNFGRTSMGKDRVRGFAGIRLLMNQQAEFGEQEL